MEKKRAIEMLIARYKADATALERREKELTSQMEILENLIPTVTICYMSKVLPLRGNSCAQDDIEGDETSKKLERLKEVLGELQQSVKMIREEEKILRVRIEELENTLTSQLGQSSYERKLDSNIPQDESNSDPGVKPKKEFAKSLNIQLDQSANHKYDSKILKHESITSGVKHKKGLGDSLTSQPGQSVDHKIDSDIKKPKLIGSLSETPKKEQVLLQSGRSSVKKIESVIPKPKAIIKSSVKHKNDFEDSLDNQLGQRTMKRFDSEIPKPGPARTLGVKNKKELEDSLNQLGQSPVKKLDSDNPKPELASNFGVKHKKELEESLTTQPRQIPDIILGIDTPKLQPESINIDEKNKKDPEHFTKMNLGDEKELRLEESFQAKDVQDWKTVGEELLKQVSELNENLKNSSEKLKESEDYVKHLAEECSKLEKELKGKMQLLEKKPHTDPKDSESNEDFDIQNKLESNYDNILKVQDTLENMKSKGIPATYTTFPMGEGEGVTPAYMQLAHWRFALKLPEYQGDRELKEKLMNGIKQGNMAPYYKEVCADLGWEFDSKLYDEMCAANVKRLEELEKEHENNVMDEEDQSQLCGVWQSKLDYLCSIGDSENASALANSKVDDKTVPKSHRIDAVFSLFRISFFHGCNIKGMSTAIDKATELIEGISGGDWSARNKLKAYEGVWSLAIRDFTRAAHLFVDVVPTFESYELADFGTIIRYTVLSCMIALPRCDLRKKLMLHGVMAQALHSQYQDLREYFVSLYDGRYSDFLVCLARIEVEMKRDPLLHPHYRHYVQEMRLRAYKQILQAYRSLSLDYMAQSFGVTSEFIEREVARFAAAGRLQCKIDSVAGTVITSAHLDDSVRSKEAPEASQDRNILYQTTVKRGDILLNRLKKLARVMDF